MLIGKHDFFENKDFLKVCIFIITTSISGYFLLEGSFIIESAKCKNAWEIETNYKTKFFNGTCFVSLDGETYLLEKNVQEIKLKK
jgi:hypothetical protein